VLGGAASVAQRTARCASLEYIRRTPRSLAGPRRRARAVRRRCWGCLPRCAPTDSPSTKRHLRGGAAASHAQQFFGAACEACGATAGGHRLGASHPWCQRRLEGANALEASRASSTHRPPCPPRATRSGELECRRCRRSCVTRVVQTAVMCWPSRRGSVSLHRSGPQRTHTSWPRRSACSTSATCASAARTSSATARCTIQLKRTKHGRRSSRRRNAVATRA